MLFIMEPRVGDLLKIIIQLISLFHWVIVLFPKYLCDLKTWNSIQGWKISFSLFSFWNSLWIYYRRIIWALLSLPFPLIDLWKTLKSYKFLKICHLCSFDEELSLFNINLFYWVISRIVSMCFFPKCVLNI